MTAEPDTPGVEIRRAEITSPVARELILALNEELAAAYPEPGANHFRLDTEEVAEGRGAFFVAYVDGRPVGCGAVRLLDADTGEVKRMYVERGTRGQGVGRALLSAIEAEGRRLGARSLVLETGPRQAEALRLYSRAGYVQIPNFGEYVGCPLSLCMKKDLGER